LHDSLLYSGLEHGNFFNISISRGSVATRLRCGGIANGDSVANLLLNLPVTEFRKSVSIWQSCGQDYSGLFFDSRCIMVWQGNRHWCTGVDICDWCRNSKIQLLWSPCV